MARTSNNMIKNIERHAAEFPNGSVADALKAYHKACDDMAVPDRRNLLAVRWAFEDLVSIWCEG